MLKTGSDKKNINQSYIADIRIPKIGIPEQRKILSNYKKITEESFNIIEVEEKKLSVQISDEVTNELFKSNNKFTCSLDS